jgi:hypothetical protein
MIRFLEYAAIFLLLLVLQEFVFDNINLGGMVNPYIYIMFIILLPLDIPGWGLLLLGFGAGGAVDVMEGTAGLQTMTATWLAFARPTVVGLLLGKDLVYEGGIPTVGRVGTAKFLRYLTVMVLLFNVPFFCLEDLSGGVWIIALRIVLSSAFSVGIIYFLHLPFVNTKLKV